MPRLKGSADLLEDRRRRALALLDSGYSLNEVGRRIGCNPSSFAFRADITTTAAAPSLMVEALPAVTVPSFLKAGFNDLSVSEVAS